jgi:hypothetical protein
VFVLSVFPCVYALGGMEPGKIVASVPGSGVFDTADDNVLPVVSNVPPVFELNPLTPAINIVAPPSRAEQVMNALLKSHPKRIKDIANTDGDWAVELNGKWFFYAEGKILPQNLLPQAGSFNPQPFYNYPKEMPAWKRPDKQEAERLSRLTILRRGGGGQARSQFFYDELWGIHNRADAWEQVKTIRFLDKSILVHHAVLEELALIELQIKREARTNKLVRQWLDGIGSISAWNWRNIADTQSTSNHAYGIAVDIQPKNIRGLETYWLWTSQKREDWWNVPYSARYQPPVAVIKIFESYGFIWGGKWAFYDTMHFEYRPEILALNNIEMTGKY